MRSMWQRVYAGAARLAGVLAALVALYSFTAAPSTLAQDSTARPASEVLPTATPNPCQVTYTVISQWSNGFVGNLTLKNTGGIPTKGWTVILTWPGDQWITQSWGISWSQSGRTVVIVNGPHNGVIVPGGSLNIGFQGGYRGTNAPPSVSCSFSY